MSVIICHPAFYFHYSVDNNREYLFEVVTSTRTFLFQVIILDGRKLACVASVSSRGSSRKLGQGPKKKMLVVN